MDPLFLGITAGVIGKILLGVTVMQVHWKIIKEHKIDKKVLTEMRRERNVALVGIVFIAVGYALEMAALGYIPGMEREPVVLPAAAAEFVGEHAAR